MGFVNIYQMNISNIKNQFDTQLTQTSNELQVEELRIRYLGRNGLLNSYFQSLTKKTKSKNGRDLNKLKEHIQLSLDHLLSDFDKAGAKQIDVTIPGIRPPMGNIHLLTQTIQEISDIFAQIGFIRRRYPEVDTDWYAAEGLNIPKDHPARDDQETFYVTSDTVLTPHTSNGQLREMETIKKPPIKMINIGKTYRRQIDVSHTPMFHQFEGLMIDKKINVTHLIGVCNFFAQNFFGIDRKIRLRPHHFQFTEPSFEIDITCGVCLGKGCRLCKSGWLELGGAGMVHPTVLKNGGINPRIYSGFAFGWGVERVLSMKSGLNIADIRNIYSIDLRLLTQF